MVCREKLSYVEKCRVLKISDGLSNGGVWKEVFWAGWSCLEVFGAGLRCLGVFWAVLGCFPSVTSTLPGDCDASRNVEKCQVLSKSLLGRGTLHGLPRIH